MNAEEVDRFLAQPEIADYIKRVVDAAPPLTIEQRDQLAELLRPVRIRRVAE